MLLLGVSISGLLLLSALLVASRTVHQINRMTQTFADDQAQAKAAIDGIERQQNDLNNRWLQLARRKDMVRREEILAQLKESRDQMSGALESAYEQSEVLRESIYQTGHGLLRWAVWLFALFVGLSLLCASWIVRTSATLFKKLETQADDLSRLQYAFLETQEETARRFSHELHDELGQALTAVKANLSFLREKTEPSRVEDCMVLVDRAIGDVREMSQLLRPTILDDFGLDAALRALTESFAQRTGLSVSYQSGARGTRLGDATETNLFRIAQEALTNIARHADAAAVTVELSIAQKNVRLTIRDDGHGLQRAEKAPGRGLGLAGMEMRARGCGGTLAVHSETGKGVTISISCPLRATGS